MIPTLKLIPRRGDMRRTGKHVIKASTLKEKSCGVTSGELGSLHVGLPNKVSSISFVDIIDMFIIKNSVPT